MRIDDSIMKIGVMCWNFF